MNSSMARRPRLVLNALEARDVPAGNVIASVSAAGLLSLLGDERDNVVTLTIVGGVTPTVTVTPFGATTVTVDGVTSGAGVAVVIPKAAKALSAKMGDGDDTLQADAATAFALTGAATIDLGGGDNTLTLSTAEKLDLGKLTVTAGDGNDKITVRGGLSKGSQILGAAQFNTGIGTVDVALGGDGIAFGDLNIKGALGVTSDGGHGVAPGVDPEEGVVVAGDHLTVGGATTLKMKGFQTVGSLTVKDSTLHAVTATGYNAVIYLFNSPVTGNVSAAGIFAGAVNVADKPVTGNVTATSGFQAAVGIKSATVTGNVSANSRFGALVNLDAATVTGNVTVGAKFTSSLTTLGITSVKNLTVTGALVAALQATGTSLTVTGNLSVTTAGFGSASFNTTALSKVAGNVNIKGGWGGGTFNVINDMFKADKNVTVDMGAFSGLVSIGDGTTVADIGGNLAVKGGLGNDRATLTRVKVAGTTTINTGAGADTLEIESSEFVKAFSADLGNGDDTISIAQFAAAPAPVNFGAKTTILAGAGNDTLTLGNAPPAAGTGDANSKAVFAVASKIDGGTGYNVFDNELGQSSGPVTIALNWTDPTP